MNVAMGVRLIRSDAGVVTTYYLWVDSTGDLRIHKAIPTNQDGDGSVVGENFGAVSKETAISMATETRAPSF